MIGRAFYVVANSLGTALMVVVALGIGFPVSLWLYDRDPPVQIIERKLEKLQASPGGELCAMTEFIRTKNCDTFAQQYVLDSRSELHAVKESDSILTTSPIGETTKRRSCFKIPEDTPLGASELIFAARDQCNLVHRLFWPINREPESYPFEIVATEHK